MYTLCDQKHEGLKSRLFFEILQMFDEMLCNFGNIKDIIELTVPSKVSVVFTFWGPPTNQKIKKYLQSSCVAKNYLINKLSANFMHI